MWELLSDQVSQGIDDLLDLAGEDVPEDEAGDQAGDQAGEEGGQTTRPEPSERQRQLDELAGPKPEPKPQAPQGPQRRGR